MSALREFEEKLVEYANNNISALVGTIQITHNEKEDLKRRYHGLEKAEQAKAAEFAKSKGFDLGL